MQTDPLSDLLDFLQARCDLSGQLVAGGAWARRFSNLDAIKVFAVTEGRCWYWIDGMVEPAQVEVGDVLVTNGTRTLTLASATCLIREATTQPINLNADDHYQLGEGCELTMLGGTVQIDADRQALLLKGLPPLIHVRGNTDGAESVAWLLKETPNKLPIIRKWTTWRCRKARFSAADYWITKAQPWFSALTGAPLPFQAIIADAPSTDSTRQTAWSVAPCSWPSHGSGFSHSRIGA